MRRFAAAFFAALTVLMSVGCASDPSPERITARPAVQWREPAMNIRTAKIDRRSSRVGAGDAIGQTIFADQLVYVRSSQPGASQVAGVSTQIAPE